MTTQLPYEEQVGTAFMMVVTFGALALSEGTVVERGSTAMGAMFLAVAVVVAVVVTHRGIVRLRGDT